MDQGKTKVVHHNRLKPYHCLKRPPGYYCALAEAKRDAPQPQVPVSSQGQRLTSVPKVVWLCRQKDGPLLSGLVCPELTGGRSSCCGSQGTHTGWLCWYMFEDVVVTCVLTMSSLLSRMFQYVKCEFSHSRADEVVQDFLKEHLKPLEVPFVCDQSVQCPHQASKGEPQERWAPGPSGWGPGQHMLWDPVAYQGRGHHQAAANPV